MEDEEAELRNPFPSPPSHYVNYTSQNLALLALLKERTADADSSAVNEHKILADQSDLPPWSLLQLEKPRVDWIVEDGHYNVFGDTWFIKETIPSLAELGGHQLYPADPSTDRRPALLSILHSILLSYSKLTASLLAPPPSITSTITPDWQRHVEWITVLAQNVMAAANDLRPVQARYSLEEMMKRQLELRREETRTLHTKCDALEKKLAELRVSAESISDSVLKQDASRASLHNDTGQGIVVPGKRESRTTTSMATEDLLSWAEEI
ncbi:hypothetical protein HWV62_34949 [Athelia sp. TMB]|nr:hypothetical protein HWV62_34949 [Athelia sp. TMB]